VEKKLKHLELVQNVISRMASNSFLIKGWCVTLVAALLALASQNSNTKYVIVALLPTVMFWILDSYFLRQERLFRKLYDQVRTLNDEAIDFSMNTSAFMQSIPLSKAAFSQTLIIFYGVILVAIGIAILITIKII
jgi:hypothetical protein